jgi:hypothetical protein
MARKPKRNSKVQKITTHTAPEQKTKKQNTPWVTILGIVGVIIAAVSAIAAIRSNKLAEKANNIAEQNLVPKLTTSLAFYLPELAKEMTDIFGDWNTSPCRWSDDSLDWQTHYLVGIDLSNTGANPFSITGIVVEDQYFGNREPLSNYVELTTSDIIFTSYEQYKDWEENTSYSLDDLEIFGKVSWEDAPMSIENGTTKRLMIGVTLNATWNGTLNRDVASKLLPDPINIPINFSLGDNTVKQYYFGIDNFFLEIFDGTEGKSLMDFSFCQ